MRPLVLPRETVPPPHVRPAAAARILARPPLKAVPLPARIILRRRRLPQQPAQVDEMLLRRRTLLQLRRPPLANKLLRSHLHAPIPCLPAPVSQPLSPIPYPLPRRAHSLSHTPRRANPRPAEKLPPTRPLPPMLALRSCSPSGATRSPKCGPASARFLLRTGCPLDQSPPQPMPLPTGRPNPLPFPTPPIASARIPKFGAAYT